MGDNYLPAMGDNYQPEFSYSGAAAIVGTNAEFKGVHIQAYNVFDSQQPVTGVIAAKGILATEYTYDWSSGKHGVTVGPTFAHSFSILGREVAITAYLGGGIAYGSLSDKGFVIDGVGLIGVKNKAGDWILNAGVLSRLTLPVTTPRQNPLYQPDDVIEKIAKTKSLTALKKEKLDIFDLTEFLIRSPEKCFCGNTLVSVSETEVRQIRSLQKGDIVFSFDSHADNGRGALVPKKVLRTFTNITTEWLRLTWLEDGEEKELVTTPSHQFLAAHGGFREIESLVSGGKGTVVLADGSEAEVISERIVYSAETADMFEQAECYVTPENGNLALKPVYKKGWKTYNFEVEDFHTYVAGGVRVHNDSWNDGKGFEFHKEEYGTGNAYALTQLEGVVPVNGYAVAAYRVSQNQSYDSTPQGRAESVAFGAAFEGGSNREVSAAAWSELKARNPDTWTSATWSGKQFSQFEASIVHGREKGRDLAAASGADQNSGRDTAGARVDTSHSHTTGQGNGGLGDYDNDGVVSAKEFRRAEQENLYNSKTNKASGGESDSSTKPVLLDLDGDGLEVTALDRSTVFLDTGGDGFLRRTAWAGEGDGVLYFDPDGRNEITEKRQFVFTEWDPTATSDLEALASVFDGNGDGVLNAADADFSKFKVLVTLADGSTVSRTLAELGITEIDLTADASQIELSDGSVITGKTTFTRSDGSTGTVGDMLLASEAQGHRVEQVEAVDGTGTRTLTTTAYRTDGGKAYVIHSEVSSDGLSITNRYDDDGDGTVDRIQSIDTVVAGDGSRTETESNYSGSDLSSAVLSRRTVTTKSADGKEETIERDSMGGGWFDQRETRVEAADGSLTIIVSDLAKDGTVITSRSETVSADGASRSDGLVRIAKQVLAEVRGTAPPANTTSAWPIASATTPSTWRSTGWRRISGCEACSATAGESVMLPPALFTGRFRGGGTGRRKRIGTPERCPAAHSALPVAVI